MKNLFRITLLLIALLAPVAAMADNAYDFAAGGIYYKIVGNEACVTYKSYSNIPHTAYYESDYTGDVVIPATVAHDGKTYPVTIIGDHAFYQCRSLTGITIPGSITAVNEGAFEGCSGLTRTDITDLAAWCNINFNSYYANPLIFTHHLYLNGAEVTDLAVPESVTSINDWAFIECSGLKGVTIAGTVTSIGDGAFQGCTGLTDIEIPGSVTTMGNDVFAYCSGLARVSLGKSVTSIGNHAFYQCTGITSIEVPNSVTTIGGNAFYGCTALRGISIPDQVTAVGGLAFYGCTALTSVSIGKSVTTIGKDAFSNAPAIETVTCKATTPPSLYNMDMFMANVFNHAALHVPAGFERAYMRDPYWGQFVSITGDVADGNPIIDPDYLKCDVNGDGEVNLGDVNVVIDAIKTH